MQLMVEKREGYLILKPQGRIDHATCGAFDLVLKPYLDECKADQTAIILDFSHVDYISSVGLRVIMMAAKQVKAQQGRISVAALTSVVAEIFAVGRFNLIYQIFDTVAEAESALDARPSAEG